MPALPIGNSFAQTRSHVEWVETQDSLSHYVSLPEHAGYTHLVPVVLAVHGWGGDERVMWAFESAYPKDHALVVVRAPFALAEGGYCWFDVDPTQDRKPIPSSVMQGLAQLERFVRALESHYPIDSTQLHYVGFSQGAAIGSALLFHAPQLISKLVMIGGFVPLPAQMLPMTDLSQKQILISHGERDEVVPITAAQRAKALLEDRQAMVEYRSYAVGHKMTLQGIRDLASFLQ
ncbi:MAG TPA: alpha/beta fold hydrolase [Anaerolineales bacterium]|nr:alpha/beta fold hydrolase [Anaerolineales bacterium]